MPGQARWFRSSRIDRIQVCGAMSAPDGELPLVPSNRQRRILHEVDPRAQRRTPPPPNQLACRCAHDRQGQVASRWPSATLDRRCAQRRTKTARSRQGDDGHRLKQGDWMLNDRIEPIQMLGSTTAVTAAQHFCPLQLQILLQKSFCTGDQKFSGP